MELYEKITKDIEEIERLTEEMKQDLRGMRSIHAGFGALLIELELLTINLAEVKKKLN
jgi:hypothetical protein